MPRGIPKNKSVEPVTDVVKSEDDKTGKILEVLTALNSGVQSLTERVAKLEEPNKVIQVPTALRVIEEAKPRASFVPPEIEAAVREFFGPSFGVKVEDCGDRPAYVLTIEVPTQFASNMIFQGEVEFKCLCGEKGKYVRKDTLTDFPCPNVKCARMIPIQRDLRVKVIGHAEGIPKIREYCEKVRKHILSYMKDKNEPQMLLT